MDTVYTVMAGGTLALLVAMGLVLRSGRGAFLIAGYNTMSAEERARYDRAALTRFVGNLLLGMAVLVALLFAGIHLDLQWLVVTAVVGSIVGPLAAVVWANTGNRFKDGSGTTP